MSHFMAAVSSPKVTSETLESAGRLVDQHLTSDRRYVELSGQLGIASHQQVNCSGHRDVDYPSIPTALPSLSTLPHVGPTTHVPLPPELLQEFQNMQCNCAMGLLPEVRRAWLTIDSTIYVWNYEDGKDLAYFDGLKEVILSAGLVLPKPGIFQEHIQYLLCLTTPVEIIILGVSFTASVTDAYSEMHLQPEPLFSLPSDNVAMLDVSGTPQGRIFLLGKDGCLYEVVYQAEDGWFSRKCRKVNHSVSIVSYLVPSFLSLSEQDPLLQISVDSSRQILYTRSERNTLQVYYLGRDGWGLSKVASISMDAIVQKATAALRTADKSLVKPLVYMAVMPSSESSTLHLMAISKAGVRLYFTTTPDGIQAPPSLLAMVHARLPPGYSPSSSAQKPGTTIHQAFYRRGTLVMASSQSDDKDSLWMVDSDVFPFQNTLMESHLTLPLEGRTWALAESIESGELEAVSSPTPLPPMVVTQHAQPARRLVLLTTQGSYLLSKMRPVDQLQYLLESCKGASGDAIEGFFRLHKDAEACAMCLILATGPSQQLALWAMEAYFRYGGEPHFVFPTSLGPANMFTGSSPPMALGSPGQYSTPTPPAPTPSVVGPSTQQIPGYGSATQSPMASAPGALGRALVGPEVQRSGKHNGLCRYLARLLRPLWNEVVAVGYKPPGSATEQFVSSYSPEELGVLAEQLYSLRGFLERNPQLFATAQDQVSSMSPSNVHQRMLHFMRPEGMPTDSPSHIQQSMLNKYKADAYLLERHSLFNVYYLVVQCCETLSLWKQLCEYQFHLTAEGLKPEEKQKLRMTTFRILITNGRELTSSLISSLLKRFAGDTGMTDSLHARLREMTPSLFSHDDAIASKAQELITMATALESRYEQLTMLRESLKYFSQVTRQISLHSVCEQYRSVRYYEGIVELSLSSAGHLDHQGLGLHFYKSGQPQDDLAGQKAFVERQVCYSAITGVLAQLLTQDQTPMAQTSAVPKQAGPPSPRTDEGKPDPRRDFEEMLTMALRSDDELFHVTLYSWLMSIGLMERLVEIQTPFVEEFLKHTATSCAQNDNLAVLNLLWKYYEKNKNYEAAARILDTLAHREGPDLTLDQRIEYISRAVMCAKSCNLATGASTVGELLHELEEKMEVARIQLSIVESLEKLPSSLDASKAVQMLNLELMDITKLYGDFAEPFGLAECKLAIVHCAGHYDPTLIESLWREIVENELKASARMPAQTRLQTLRAKLLELGKIYARTERFFPLAYLVQLLEQHSCQFRWEIDFVHQTLHAVGTSVTTLFSIYDRMFREKDPFWESVHQPLRLLGVVHSLLSAYVTSPSLVSAYERPSFNAVVMDATSHYLVELQTMNPATPNVAQTIADFRSIERQIHRIV